jgi:hypothetical protein
MTGPLSKAGSLFRNDINHRKGPVADALVVRTD